MSCRSANSVAGLVNPLLVLALVSGMGYERVADASCSATTLRRRREEWIAAGVLGHLVLTVLRAYDQMVGLGLENLAADGCIAKLPSGGDCAGRSPVDRGKQGIKRSQLTDDYGVPVVTVPAGANIRDHTLLPETLDECRALEPAPRQARPEASGHPSTCGQRAAGPGCAARPSRRCTAHSADERPPRRHCAIQGERRS